MRSVWLLWSGVIIQLSIYHGNTFAVKYHGFHKVLLLKSCLNPRGESLFIFYTSDVHIQLILHKLSKIMLSGKSTYGSQEQDKCFESQRCVHQAKKGEINGFVAHVHVIVIWSIQVVSLLTLKHCDICVLHTSQYFQNMLC